MKFLSTRHKSPPVYFSDAILRGLAEDGGLYVPEQFPTFGAQTRLKNPAELGEIILKPFLEGDVLAGHEKEICQSAINFPIPLVDLKNDNAVLELFHGPTSAFKDVGARFLAECMRLLPSKPRTVIVATSGDTGGAVAAAFFKKPNAKVIILYPKGKVSPRQEKQLTAWGENIRAFAVQGTFDDCQKIVKESFADEDFRLKQNLISSNSISVGRLLPQSFYYAWSSSVYFEKHKVRPGFIIPSGNLGNAVAAFWAKKMGFPIGKIIMATNANTAIPEYFKSGVWKAKSTIATLANAMDVGNPSNMERLLSLYPKLDELSLDAESVSVSDEEISECIRTGENNWGQIWCPHTATAVHVLEQKKLKNFIVVATAHPAKFQWIVEKLIGKTVSIPKNLQAILNAPSQIVEIEASFTALKRHI